MALDPNAVSPVAEGYATPEQVSKSTNMPRCLISMAWAKI